MRIRAGGQTTVLLPDLLLYRVQMFPLLLKSLVDQKS